MGSNQYDFRSSAAKARWHRCRPLVQVTRELGYPILLSDEVTGASVPVESIQRDTILCPSCLSSDQACEYRFETSTSCSQLSASSTDNDRAKGEEEVVVQVNCAWCIRESEERGMHETKWRFLSDRVLQGHLLDSLKIGDSQIAGIGVFSTRSIRANEFIGCYFGTVYTEEEWPEDADENFLFNMKDGEVGVLVDGREGSGVNALKYLNHSCEPNVRMEEAFIGGSWWIVVYSLRDIEPGEELLHDFALHTEDSAMKDVPCLCGSTSCRGNLFRYFAWDE